MIIASIAMEELALSHIINAEGEKLQYILGALPGAKPCAGPQEVLAVNKSVTALLDVVANNQMLLKSKLEKVLEACPLPAPPCPPPAPPCPPPSPCPPPWTPCPPPCPAPRGPEPCCPPPGSARSGKGCALQLAERQPGLLWLPGCRLPWRPQAQQGTCIRWNPSNPTQIRLNPQGAYAVRCTLTVRAMPPAEGEGRLCLRQTPRGAFTEAPPLRFSLDRAGGGLQTLRYTAALHPRGTEAGAVELSLVLDTKNALWVERASMNVAEL